jgi:ATP-dependent DNA helicase RecQ
VTGFNRPNLLFEVFNIANEYEKQERIGAFISKGPGAGIVYVGKRRDAEDVASFLCSKLGQSIPYYHAGMTRHERTAVQDRFMTEPSPCVVATNAFGMGIDRADLRWVIHYQMPGTLEAYYQEAGRAGRDGRDARAILLYSHVDRGLQEWFIENDAPTEYQIVALHSWLRSAVHGQQIGILPLRDEARMRTGISDNLVRTGIDQLQSVGMLSREGPDPVRDPIWNVQSLNQSALRKIASSNSTRRAHKERQLERMIGYATSGKCRRRVLLDYFGDEWPGASPRCCDCCLGRVKPKTTPVRTPVPSSRVEWPDEQVVQEAILECVQAFPEMLTNTNLARLLVGSDSYHVSEFADHPLFGRLHGISRKFVTREITDMLQEGRIERTDDYRLMPAERVDAASARTGTRDRTLATRVVAMGDSGEVKHVPDLIAALSDPDGNVRRLAASALGKLGSPDAVPALLQLLDHETGPQVRQYSIVALGKIGDQRAMQKLAKISEDAAEKGYNRVAAREALERIRVRY